MKKIFSFIGFIIAGISAQLSGHAIWVLALVNFAWMLVKDHQLFSWWYVGYAAMAFALSIAVLLTSWSLVAILDD